MNKRKKYIVTFILSLALCFNAATNAQNPEKKNAIKISGQAGISHGGIVESSEIDGFTGATKFGTNAGVHINKPFRSGELESGIDYHSSKQTFTYSDNTNNYNGKRNTSLNQIIIPITYNFNLFKSLPKAEFQLKLGVLGQFNFLSTNDSGVLPDFTYNNFSGGIVLGASVYPFIITDKYKLGFYVDLYKGSQMYKDLYNEKITSSFIRAGIRFRFK